MTSTCGIRLEQIQFKPAIKAKTYRNSISNQILTLTKKRMNKLRKISSAKDRNQTYHLIRQIRLINNAPVIKR